MGFGLVHTFAFAVFALALPQVLVLWPAAADVTLSRPMAWGLVAVSLAVALWLAARPVGAGDEERSSESAAGARAVARAAVPASRHGPAAAAWGAGIVAFGFGAALWVALWLLAWRRPVYDWDGLYYHLPAMSAWAAAARVHWIPGLSDLPFANGYPMALETLGFIVHRATGTSRLSDAGNLLYWPLAALSLAVIAARFGATGPWRLAAAGLIGAIPGWVILSATCYVDPGFASAAAATLAAALLWAASAPAHAMQRALLFGAAGGLMVGAKGQGLPFFAIAICCAAVARGRAAGSRGLPAQIGLAALTAFAVGGYWALRNLFWSGNPVFPIEWKLGAKVIAAGYDTGALLDGNMPGWVRSAPAWWRVPLSWSQPDAPIRGYAATGGLGFTWLLAALPALLLLPIMLRRRVAARRSFLLAAAIGLAWLAIQPAPWWARMTLWLHALGLPALAAVLAEAARSRRAALAWAAPLALLAVLALGASESLGAFDAERRLGLRDDGAYQTSAGLLFPGLEAACPEFLAAPAIARGPWSRFGTLLGGVLAQPLGARRVVALGEEPDSARLAALRADGIEWVVWDEVRAPAPAALRAAALDSCAYRPHADQRFLMVRIARAHQRPGITRR